MEGDTVRIECVATSVPRPEKVTWTHSGYEVDSGECFFKHVNTLQPVLKMHIYLGDPRISILEDSLPGGVRSTLVIREAHDRHFGSYNCTVANAYGSGAAEILVKKQSKI